MQNAGNLFRLFLLLYYTMLYDRLMANFESMTSVKNWEIDTLIMQSIQKY